MIRTDREGSVSARAVCVATRSVAVPPGQAKKLAALNIGPAFVAPLGVPEGRHCHKRPDFHFRHAKTLPCVGRILQSWDQSTGLPQVQLSGKSPFTYGLCPIVATFRQSICSVHQADLRDALIPTRYARTPARCEQQLSGDRTMLSKSKIAWSFAAALGAASVSLTTHAFAQNDYLDRGGYEVGSKNGKTGKPQMNRDQRWNAIRGERSKELSIPVRWIDAPASPGG
jgi:hypothetical protein